MKSDDIDTFNLFIDALQSIYGSDIRDSYFENLIRFRSLVVTNIQSDFPWHANLVDRTNGTVHPDLDMQVKKLEKVLDENYGSDPNTTGYRDETYTELLSVLKFLQQLQKN